MQNNEQNISMSYNKFCSNLNKLYPVIDKDDEELLAIIYEFALIHDNAYFETGVLAGFQLYKEFEDGYKKLGKGDIQDVLKNEEGVIA